MAATATISPGPGGTSYAKLVQLRKGNGDPLGQTGPAGMDATINSVYQKPLTDAQIQGHAQMQIDPIIAALTGQISDRATQASGAIAANSGALAKDLAGVDWGAPYTQAKQEQAAVDAALQGSLAGAGGTALAGDLRSRLAQIDDPAVAALAGEVGSRGAELGTTELARGSANLSNLIALAAADRSYGQKQPGIAKLAGLQDIAGITRQAGTDIADARTKTLDMLPQIVASLRSSSDSVAGNRAQLLATLLGQNITKATASAGLRVDQGKATAAAASRPDATLSRAYGYAVDQYGNPITDTAGNPRILPGYKLDPATGQVVKAGPAAGAAKPLTSTAARNVVSSAASIGNGALKGGTDKAGTYHPPLHYDQAVEELRNQGLLSNPQSAKLALATLKRIYKIDAPASDQVDLLTAQVDQRTGKPVAPTGPPPTKKQKALNDKLFPLVPGL